MLSPGDASMLTLNFTNWPEPKLSILSRALILCRQTDLEMHRYIEAVTHPEVY